MHDKHEEALLNHTTFETDEDMMEQFVHIEKPKMKKPKKDKKKKESRFSY